METHESLTFKIATEDWEFDLIHQLNFKTFVEEIPQHQAPKNQRLVDKFHAENTYLICLCGRKLAGMLALRANRPFSLDQKLANLDEFLPKGRVFCEIRLLAVDKKFRTGQVFQGLMAMVWQQFVEHGWDMGLISGTTRQIKLYQHVGFIPFGPLVGKEGAMFQPMYLSIESFEAGAREFLTHRASRSLQRQTVNFLPGPVQVSRAVRRAFEAGAESHRTEGFLVEFQATKEGLCALAGARSVEILLGSGTLANDAIAAQISLLKGRGLIITNGEFSERLIDHARRFNLDFEAVQFRRGRNIDFSTVRSRMETMPVDWIWTVHCETSTGILNDIGQLNRIASEGGAKLCLDCISSIGTMPVELNGVYLASSSSGKGLRSFPGLSMVFYNHEIHENAQIPRYLDLGLYARQRGVAFTHSSNLVMALQTAIKRVDWPSRFSEVREATAWLRPALRDLGFVVVGADNESSPAVTTLALPARLDSAKVGLQLQEAGFLLSCNSDYLRRQNWIQICLMGEFQRDKLVSLLSHLKRICFPRSQAPQIASGGARLQI